MEEMKFAEIIDILLEEGKVRRKSWPEGVFIQVRDGSLKIYNPEDKKVRPLLVSDGDLLGEDWVTI